MNNIFYIFKNLTLTVFIFFVLFSSFAQNVFAVESIFAYEYTNTISVAGGYISPVASAVDSDDNVYIAGYFSGTSMDFDPGAGVDTHTSNGIFDIFLTKINADGSYGYTKTIGDDSYESANSIGFDSDNNVYIAGYFGSASMDFDPTAGVDTHTSNGGTDIFFTKINADGSYGYTKTAGGSADDVISSIGIDSLNNIYIGGYYFDVDVDFDPSGGVDTHTNNGSGDIFLTKINADGSYGYTKTMGGGGSDFIYPIEIDSADNIYLAGHFSTGSMDFDPSVGVDTHTNNGDTDMFLTKINADGSYGYTKTMGGGGGDAIYSIVADSSDNLYLAGYFSGASVDFDSTVAVDAHTSNGGTDIFLTKINADGSYGYTKTAGGAAGDVVKSIEVDSNNNVYIAGYFASTSVDFDPTVGVDTYTNGNNDGSYDIFLTKINTDETYGYTKAVGGDGYDGANSVAIDSNNSVYIAGYFGSASMDFDPTEGVDTHTLTGSSDAFLSKFSQTEVVAVVEEETQNTSGSRRSVFNNNSRQQILNTAITVAPASILAEPVLTPNSNTKFLFFKNLRQGMTDTDVKELQKYLNANGFPVATTGNGSVGNESTFFGPRTKSALIKFQFANNIKPAFGYFGVITRGVVNGE